MGAGYEAGYERTSGGAPTTAAYLINSATDVSGLSGEVLIGSLTSDLSFVDSGSFVLLHLDVADNQVGIGTSTPSETLHVVGTSLIAGDGSDFGLLVTNTTIGSVSTIYSRASSTQTDISLDRGGLGLANSDSTLNNYTKILFATVDSVATERISAHIGAIFGARGAGTTTATLVFATANAASDPTEVMRIEADGDVGIGTSSPASKLDVTLLDAVTTLATFPLTVTHTTTGTAAAGMGVGISFVAENDAGTTAQIGTIHFAYDEFSGGDSADYVIEALINGTMTTVFLIDADAGSVVNTRIGKSTGLQQLTSNADIDTGIEWEGSNQLVILSGGSAAIQIRTTGDVVINEDDDSIDFIVESNATVIRLIHCDAALRTIAFGATASAEIAVQFAIPTVTPSVDANGSWLTMTPALTEAGSGTHALMAGVNITALSLTGAGAATTTAVTLYISGPPSGGTNNYSLYIDDGPSRFDDRILGFQGSDVASGTTITLSKGNYFDVTGTTTINHISTSGWTVGSFVVLQFDASVTVTHDGASPPAGTVPIKLAAAGNFGATANDTLMLVYDGTYFREVARTAI